MPRVNELWDVYKKYVQDVRPFLLPTSRHSFKCKLPEKSIDQAGRGERKRITKDISKDVYVCEDERAVLSEMS